MLWLEVMSTQWPTLKEKAGGLSSTVAPPSRQIRQPFLAFPFQSLGLWVRRTSTFFSARAHPSEGLEFTSSH